MSTECPLRESRVPRLSSHTIDVSNPAHVVGASIFQPAVP